MSDKAHFHQKRLTIGLQLPNIFEDYSALVWKGVLEQAKLFGVNIILYPGDALKSNYAPYNYQNNYVYNLTCPKHLDGLIINAAVTSCVSRDEFIEYLQSIRDIPLLTMNFEYPDYPAILTDNSKGIYDIVQHLVTVHDRKNIAYLGGPEENSEAVSRHIAYRNSLEKFGLKYQENLVLPGNFEKSCVKKAINILLDDRKASFDAIIAANDSMAFGVLEELAIRKIRIPEDVSVCGFDNLPESQFTNPPLTTVAQPIFVQAAKALEMIIEMVETGKKPETLAVSTNMRIRESCGCDKKSPFVVDGNKFRLPEPFSTEELDTAVVSFMENFEISGPRLLQMKSFIEYLLPYMNCQDYTSENKNFILDSFEKLMDYFEEFEIPFDVFTDLLNELELLEKNNRKENCSSRIIAPLFIRLEFRKKKKLYQDKEKLELLSNTLRNMMQDMISSEDLPTMLKLLGDWLPKFGIKLFQVYLFDNPFIHKVDEPWPVSKNLDLLISINTNSVEKVPVKNPKSLSQSHFWTMLDLQNKEPSNYMLKTFYYNETSYGFMLFDFNPSNIYRYQYISMALNNFYHVLSLKAERELNQELLTEERSKLSKRNLEMEKDLLFARKIQSMLIPNKSPNESIAFCYKSMELVGGDFLDFVVFRENSWVGLFVSDVSGHGVPAAFITSMIKSALNQTRDKQDNPSSLLLTLNKSLYNQTGGNFVTALYGLYIPEAQKFCFANAGHNQPLLIEDGIISPIHQGNRSLPLGVMDSQDMLMENKSYTNYTIQLKKGSKLVLFTDGLLEATSGRDVELDFENGPMNQVMLENADKTASEFVQNVYQRLVEFHGSELFDDDVCLICLDV